MSVKRFMMNPKHQQGYRDAVHTTGPINNTSIYHQAASAGASTTEQGQNFISYDDPYWREFMLKTRKREDQWKQPSGWAWDHKEYGIVGEVIDMDRLRKNYEKNFNTFV